MTAKVSDRFCGAKLHTICLIIGYLHLASSILDITYHVLTLAIVTSGFQCDVNVVRLQEMTNLPIIEPLLLIFNLGTHGFYPFPHNFKYQYNVYVEFMSVTAIPRCYPGMLHVYLIDVLNFFINIIWLKAVISFIKALYKKDPEQMGMFFGLSIVKLLIQVLYLGYQPQFYESIDVQTYWSLKILDIVIAIFFLVIVRKCAKMMKAEKEERNTDCPPPYVEYLVGSVELVNKRPFEKKEAVINVEVKKEKADDDTTKSQLV